MDPISAAENCLSNVLEVKPKEHLIIVCDSSLADIGRIFKKGAGQLQLTTNLVTLNDSEIRKSAPKDLISMLKDSKVDVFINILRGMSEETPFRIEIVSTERDRRLRLGHCPGITEEMFSHGALAMTDEDYKEMNKLADKLLNRFKGARRVKIKCPMGTDLEMNVEDREFFTDIRVDWETMKWMNLPVGEVIVAPIENSLEGTLVCTHSIGGIGILKNPVTVKVHNGKAMEIDGDTDVVSRIERAVDIDDMARYVGEFALGINQKAKFVEEFLETEKVIGTCHIAFGNNADFPGGKNTSKNHMDFLMLKPTITVLGQNGENILMKDGQFQL